MVGILGYPGVHTVACRAEHESGKIFYFEKDEHIGNPAEDIPKEHASYEVIATILCRYYG